MTNYNDTQIIIMAGGIGSRFWPMSTPDYPKQFIDVMGVGRSLIQLTVDRLKPICPVENMWVVTNEKYISIVKEQIPDMPVDRYSQSLGRSYQGKGQAQLESQHHFFRRPCQDHGRERYGQGCR